MIAVVASIAWIRLSLIRTYEVPSDSMHPTLRRGDVILGVLSPRTIERGDIVVVATTSRQSIVKRVIALPGDHIRVNRRGVFLNGHALAEPYASGTIRADTPDVQDIVPAGHIWLLGDNRAQSLDSRVVGPLPRANVQARVTMILFSTIDGDELRILQRVE